MAPLPLATATITASAPASAITLAPRFDLEGIIDTVTGGVGTAVKAASDGIDQAKDGVDAIKVSPGIIVRARADLTWPQALKTTAQEVENFKKSMDAVSATDRAR